jgi:hypothetical protein
MITKYCAYCDDEFETDEDTDANICDECKEEGLVDSDFDEDDEDEDDEY